MTISNKKRYSRLGLISCRAGFCR